MTGGASGNSSGGNAGNDNGNKYALAGSRLNIAMRMKAARDEAKQSLDASRTNIRMAMQTAKQKAMEADQGNKQALAASRLNIAMRMRSARNAAKQEKDALTFKKDMSFLLMPLFNPGSMWATMFSSRQTFSAMNTSTGKAFSGKYLGGMAAGPATALLVAAATATGLALKALTATVKQTLAAYENARQIYSKALQNGMGLQWSTKRGLLAQIMGVSEQDVFRFGAQMAYLNPKLEQASQILARTATPLTQVSWEFKVLKADLSAMFAKLATDATPAILHFIDALDKMVKDLIWLHDHIPQPKDKDMAGLAGFAIGGPMLGLLVRNAAAKDDATRSKMPSPASWMKQLPASSWEHLGLGIAGAGGSYQKEIARSTASIARDIKTVAKHLTSPNLMNTGGGWNMMPYGNNP